MLTNRSTGADAVDVKEGAPLDCRPADGGHFFLAESASVHRSPRRVGDGEDTLSPTKVSWSTCEHSFTAARVLFFLPEDAALCGWALDLTESVLSHPSMKLWCSPHTWINAFELDMTAFDRLLEAASARFPLLCSAESVATFKTSCPAKGKPSWMATTRMELSVLASRSDHRTRQTRMTVPVEDGVEDTERRGNARCATQTNDT